MEERHKAVMDATEPLGVSQYSGAAKVVGVAAQKRGAGSVWCATLGSNQRRGMRNKKLKDSVVICDQIWVLQQPEGP